MRASARGCAGWSVRSQTETRLGHGASGLAGYRVEEA